MDFAPVAAYCEQINVPFTLLPSEIHHIIFDLRKEKNPCSMCAKMRRGALPQRHQGAGHQQDCPGATTLTTRWRPSSCPCSTMGRLSCFQPVTWLDRMGISQIRPMLYCGEGLIRNARRAQPPAGGVQSLPRRWLHQAAGGQGADPHPGPAVSGLEEPGVRGHARTAPARLGGRWSTAGYPCPRDNIQARKKAAAEASAAAFAFKALSKTVPLPGWPG